MPAELKKTKREIPLNAALSQGYLTQETIGSMGLQEIAREIEGGSSLLLGDVPRVLSRITVSSEGMATADELNAHHVEGIKLVFLLCVELKRSLGDISFERAP
ncbi:hypothetical protein Holit_01012 [Hollandina sp. SP2]